MDDNARAELVTIAKDAAIWALPLVLLSRYVEIAEAHDVPTNRFMLDRELSSPKSLAKGPNVDTIYGHAWIDVSEGPVVLHVPDANDRYYSIQIQDAYMTTITYVGRRLTGTAEREFLLVGPNWSGEIPEGMDVIASPTNLMIANTRVHVRNPSDLEAAQRMQDGLLLGALAGYPESLTPPVIEESATDRFPTLDLSTTGARYFDEVGRLLLTQPPPASDDALLERFARVGIGAGLTPSRDPVLAPILAEGLVEGVAEVQRTSYSSENNGWYGNRITGRTPTIDPLMRAAININGPGWHLVHEALYLSAPMVDGKRLDGADQFRLRFPPGGTPPVDSFWSMTMYSGSNLALYENAIKRYAIGSATEGLVFDDDGSLEIAIQHDEPTDTKVNWLPAPEGPFMMIIRLYQPSEDLLEGRYEMPRLVRT
jgi:hypothetical protein